MQRRGAKYWLWADLQLEANERLETELDGTIIDVRARISRTSVTQLFVGVYKRSGTMVAEEYYPQCADLTVEQAIDWGRVRGRFLIESVCFFSSPHKLNAAVCQHDLTETCSTSVGGAGRHQFLHAADDARRCYRSAQNRMTRMMRAADVAGPEWEQCRADLQNALDRVALLARVYDYSVQLTDSLTI